ncbi:DUF6443 domain-containing protein [Chryseobacterium kwangjuense]|uniref:DUF6443 domain-containing protein n=1 Tax=Chryseobacterium kwangjuense TaxID=267125 RepID=A0A135W8B9_9FLAO|nr:DUF6443 domain-containing protein [Chryseobacterium kwangjuense]KXH81151.1 hypothetical protein AU378_15625 [Chryseobacterium kwangjuense]
MKKYLISKIILLLGLCNASGFLQAQVTDTENYVQSVSYLDSTKVSDASKKRIETIQYFDGLGRPRQTVNVKASPQGKDVVTAITYDNLGRQAREYFPVPQNGTTAGAIYPQTSGNVPYLVADPGNIYAGEKIFSEKQFESSPLNKIKQLTQPGTAWSTKPVQYLESANKQSDHVKKYETVTTWDATNKIYTSGVPQSSFYSEGQLYKYITADEDGNQTIEFKNSQGQAVLVRKVLSATENADTYYVYNEYDQLAYVIPPAAAIVSIDATVLDNLCYQYKYDSRYRLVEKKLPGKGWEFMVYDKQDRLILTQDAVLRTTTNTFNAKGWLFTKYDRFDRIVYTGFFSNTATRVAMQTAVNNMVSNAANNENRTDTTPFSTQEAIVYYTKNAFPTGSMKILTINYYDTYPPGMVSVIPVSILDQKVLKQPGEGTVKNTNGLALASYIINIEEVGAATNYNWYDTKGRVIGTYSMNYLGGHTTTETEYDFGGAVKQTITKHRRSRTEAEKIIKETFTYDHQNRMLVHKHKIDNNTEEILAQNTYNELSQLASKKVGGVILTSPLQTIDYKYNIRGWMTQINDPANLGTDLFGYKINYNQVEGLETPNSDFLDLKVKPKYNGNIAEISWKTLTEDNEPLKRYGYVYDPLNRLSAGFYQKAGNESAKEYFEKLDYDLNGNITRLKRSAGLLPGSTVALGIDNLRYDYTGNRLTKVTDEQQNPSGYPYVITPNTIEYDHGSISGNGNMTKNLDKGISSIEYNYLNLPKQITQNSKVTSYLYRADGVKLKKLFGDIETNYLDGFQYKSTKPSEENSSGGGIILEPDPSEVATIKLRIIPTSEGYYDALSNQYIYNFTDHLGNVRLSYTDTNKDGFIQPRQYFQSQCEDIPWDPWNPPSCIDIWKPGEIVEINNYYPFGLLHNYTATTQNAYQYKYNGKELQETGMYDYGARFYMADIGRWGVVDPLAEKTRRWTPYVYAGDNPLRFIDPDGRTWGDPKQEEKLTNRVEKRIAKLERKNEKAQQKLDQGKLKESKLAKLNAQVAENTAMIGSMNQSLKDIQTIADAKETFYLTGPSQDNGTHGVVKTTDKDGKDRINIEGTGTALHLHEIRHVGQSYKAGGMKFNSKGQLKTSAKSFSEGRAAEVEAYKTGYSYDTNSYPVPVNSINDINEKNLMDIKTSDGTQVYKALDVKDK